MNEQEQMQEREMRYLSSFNIGLLRGSMLISVLFHPLLLLLYAYILLAWSNPFLFGETSFAKVFGNKVNQMLFIWLSIFSFAVPTLVILMMKALGFVSKLSMPDRMERIGPYIVVGFLYIIIFVNFYYNPSVPDELRIFSLGATIALFMAFFINLFSKISMHTVGIGGFLGMVILMMARSHAGNEYLVPIVLIFAGLVGTARLMLAAHESADIYGGYMIGFLAQLLATMIISPTLLLLLIP